MKDFVTLELRLESMRYNIIQAFSAEMLNLENKIVEEVNRIINEVNFEKEIREYVQKVYRQEFERVVKRKVENQIWNQTLKIEKIVSEVLNEKI